MSEATANECSPPNSSLKVSVTQHPASVVSRGSAPPSIISASESSDTSQQQLNLPNSSRLTDLATYSGGRTLRDRLLTPPSDEDMYRHVKESLNQGRYKSPTASLARVVRRVDEEVPDVPETQEAAPQTKAWLIQAKESLLRLVPWRKGKTKVRTNPNGPIEYIKEVRVKRSTSDIASGQKSTNPRTFTQRANSLRSNLRYGQVNQRAPTSAPLQANQMSGLSDSSIEALPLRPRASSVIPPSKLRTAASTSFARPVPSSDPLHEATEEARRLALGIRRSWHFQEVSES